jgi:hypothetical protein
MTSIKILHVSGLGCHPQGAFFRTKEYSPNVNLGIALALLELLKF